MGGFFLVDAPRGGAENMAIDQFMLRRAAELQLPLVRFYQWSRPTLSLGYFQKFADRQQHPSSLGLDVVRRATGGGAIVHHHDWTYAVAVPNRWLNSATSTAAVGASQHLYQCVHAAVVDWLRQLGYPARLWDSRCAPSAATLGCSFLCFHRRSPGDIVVEQAKIMGSAQRRVPGAVLQHGSLLLATSPHAPSLTGLGELAASNASDSREAVDSPAGWTDGPREDFQKPITAAVATLTGALPARCHSLRELLETSDNWTDSKFHGSEWTHRL